MTYQRCGCESAPDGPTVGEPDEAVAWDRNEDEACERGTVGCSVRPR